MTQAERELVRNWEREARMEAIYRSLAGASRDPSLRRRLLTFAEDEGRHAEAWAEVIRDGGAKPPQRVPVLAPAVFGAFARVVGVKPMIGLAEAAEGRVLRAYLSQVQRLEGDRAQQVLKVLIPEESEHAHGHLAGSGYEDHSEVELHGSGIESIRNVIYGVNDGLTATLGVLAGVGGATVDARVVLVGGLAAMTASAVSMAGGAYLATKSQREVSEDQLAREAAEIEAMPDLERRELARVYLSKGLTESEVEPIVNRITQDKRVWLATMAREELGIDPDQFENPIREAIVAGLSTLVGGAIPVLGYLLGRALFATNAIAALVTTFLICLLFLFVTGSARSFFTGKGGIRSGLEMLGVGAAVAAVTYGVGVLFRVA